LPGNTHQNPRGAARPALCQKDRTMSIRFSTEAANADVLGDDTLAEGMSDEVGADGTPRSRDDPHRKGQTAAGEAGEGKPGKDINAPGFIKDKDGSQPS
jgi:hypothetical protein